MPESECVLEVGGMTEAYGGLRGVSPRSTEALCALKLFLLNSFGVIDGLKMPPDSLSALDCLPMEILMLEIGITGLGAPCGEVACPRGVW